MIVVALDVYCRVMCDHLIYEGEYSEIFGRGLNRGSGCMEHSSIVY